MDEYNIEINPDIGVINLSTSHPIDQFEINEKQEPILTKSELFAWYLYAFACEVYSAVSISSFIPLILEHFASEKGVTSIDRTPCNETIKEKEVRCIVNIFGFWIDTASFSLYTFSLSVILQAITTISIGATADHGVMRKKLLLNFAFVGSISAVLFLFIPPGSFIIAGILTIIGNVSFGAAFVCFNGFLPLIVRNHKDVRRISDEIKYYIINKNKTDEHDTHVEDDEISLEERKLLNSQDPKLINYIEILSKTKDRISTHISARGFASGYLGGIVLLIICLFISSLLHSTIYSLQIGVFLSGIWWFLFSLFVAKWLQPRPGPPLFSEGKKRWIDYMTFSWKRLWKTVIHVRKLEMTFRFLIAWILISDGCTTISSVALLFAKTTLNIDTSGLIILTLIAPIAALISNLLFPRLIKLSIKKTILLLLFMLLLIPIYGCLGLILPIGGLRTSGELYFVAVWFGFVLGSLQSYCRTMFAELVPHGRETEFFALYAITDKGSSWLGPSLVAIIVDITHEIRYGFLLLIVLILLSIPIMWFIDEKKGKDDAVNSSIDNEDITHS